MTWVAREREEDALVWSKLFSPMEMLIRYDERRGIQITL
jgi:hypothetical protein